jgi:hypothetical protein
MEWRVVRWPNVPAWTPRRSAPAAATPTSPINTSRLRLKGGIIAVVDDNPRDGMWIVVKYVETPDGPVESDQVEMVMTDDVLGLA